MLPYDDFEITSPLAQMEAIRKLAEEVEPKKTFRVFGGDKYFEGEIVGSAFRIRRIIGYRNSFLPQLRGSISPSGPGSLVRVRMRMAWSVMAFMAFWLAFVGAALVGTLYEESLSAVIPAGMLAFGFALPTLAFGFEARKQKAKLLELFGGATATRARAKSSSWPNG